MPADIQDVAPGLWIWRMRHPAWRSGLDWPETVTDSSSAPTFMSALIVAVKLAGNSTPSRLNTLKPGNVNDRL